MYYTYFWGDNMREYAGESTRRYRETVDSTKSNKTNDRKSNRLKTFIKQSAAVAVLLIIITVINRSSFEFAKNCVSALSRAVNHEFDWRLILDTIKEYSLAVWRFWSEIF